MKKFKKVILLGIVIAILGVFWLSSGITENLLKFNTESSIQAYKHNPDNILENVFEKDGQTILPFIFENSNQTITKVNVIEHFQKAGLNIENGSELGDIIVTGDVIKTNSKSYTVLIYGDVNRDGSIDTFDAQLVLQHYVYGKLSGIYEIAGNVNNSDNDTDVFDAQRILRFYVGFETKLVVNEPESQKQPNTPEKPEYTVPTDLNAVYGDTLKDVTLPEGFTFQDDLTTKVGDVGENKFKVTYTPEDTDKYETIKDIEVIITVEKAIPEYVAPTNLTAIQGDTLGDIKLPEGFTFQDVSTTKLEKIGANIVKVTYTPQDIKNYEIVKDIEISILVKEKEEIEKEDPEYEVPTGLTAIYGDTLGDVTLPKGFTFQDASTTKVGNAGIRTFLVTYTPEDTDKYKVVTDIEVTILVGKAKPLYTVPKNLKAYYGDTLGDIKLPEGFTFQDALTTEVGTTGTKTFLVTYTPKDINNYEVVRDIKVTVIVDKPRPGYTVPTGLTAMYGDTLGDVTLPEGFTYQDPLTTKLDEAGSKIVKVTYTPTDDNFATVTDIDVIITVGKVDITVIKEEKQNYYIYDEHKITATIGQNAKDITNLTWEISDENGIVGTEIAEIREISSNGRVFEINFVAKEAKEYTITPIVGGNKQNAEVIPVSIETKDNPTISSIVLRYPKDSDNNENTQGDVLNKIEIRKNQTKVVNVYYYHDYGTDANGNKIEKEITTGVTGTLTVTPTPTEDATQANNLQVVLQNENGNTVTSVSDLKQIWLKGLKNTNTESLKIEIDGQEKLNIPVIIEKEAPKELVLEEQAPDVSKLYLGTQDSKDDWVSKEGYTLIPVHLTSLDVEKMYLTKGDVLNKIRIGIDGIDPLDVEDMFWKTGYKNKVEVTNNLLDIDSIGLKINTAILPILETEVPGITEKLIKTNKITLYYTYAEGEEPTSMELDIAVQKKQLTSIISKVTNSATTYYCYDEIGINVTSGIGEEKIASADTLSWRVVKKAESGSNQSDVTINDDTAKVTVGNNIDGVISSNFVATKKGKYELIPILTTQSGETIEGKGISFTISDLTVDQIIVDQVADVSVDGHVILDISFMHKGKPIDVEAKRLTITPEPNDPNVEPSQTDSAQILLQTVGGHSISATSTQIVKSIYIKGLKSTTEAIKLKIVVDGQEKTISINVKPKTLMLDNELYDGSDPVIFDLNAQTDDIVYIPIYLASTNSTTKDILDREQIKQNIKISIIKEDSTPIDEILINDVFWVDAYTDKNGNPIDQTKPKEKAPYIGIKIMKAIVPSLYDDEKESLKSGTKLKVTYEGAEGEIELNINVRVN